MRQKRKIKGRSDGTDEERGEKEFYLFFFFLFASFSDLQKSDCRISSEQEAKLIHAARTTRGYQNLGVSSNSTR